MFVAVDDDLGVSRQPGQQFRCRTHGGDVASGDDEQAISEELEARGVGMRARIGTKMQHGAAVCAQFSSNRHCALGYATPRGAVHGLWKARRGRRAVSC